MKFVELFVNFLFGIEKFVFFAQSFSQKKDPPAVRILLKGDPSAVRFYRRGFFINSLICVRGDICDRAAADSAGMQTVQPIPAAGVTPAAPAQPARRFFRSACILLPMFTDNSSTKEPLNRPGLPVESELP